MRAQPIFARLRFLIATAIALAIATSAAFSSKLSAEPLRDPRPDTVTRQEVWQAIVTDLDTRGLSQPQWPRVEDLDMPAALPALAGRRLRVLSACWDEGPRRTQFRLECGAPGECLPFLVYVGEGAGGDANVSAGAQAASCRLAQMPRLAPAVALKPAVRPGDRARAVFVANGLRMTASVTCLERGREGEVIRVRALDGHIFRARISGPALLEALPQ